VDLVCSAALVRRHTLARKHNSFFFFFIKYKNIINQNEIGRKLEVIYTNQKQKEIYSFIKKKIHGDNYRKSKVSH
jgi:hypothetical protein